MRNAVDSKGFETGYKITKFKEVDRPTLYVFTQDGLKECKIIGATFMIDTSEELYHIIVKDKDGKFDFANEDYTKDQIYATADIALISQRLKFN